MLEGSKVIVVMPAYNAEKTLEATYREIPRGVVDEILVIDDNSSDRTVEVARSLGLEVFVHEKNKGYGANQKTCYEQALKRQADIVVMIHPDYQYNPKLITAMAGLICSGMFDMVLGSRILGGYALKGGMPLYKYISNRVLTFLQNILLQQKLSEYHTGFRAFSRRVLLNLPLFENSDDFAFDNQIIAQAIFFGYKLGEITSPSRYAKDSSSISFKRSCKYGMEVIYTSLQFAFARLGLVRPAIFNPDGKRIKP